MVKLLRAERHKMKESSKKKSIIVNCKNRKLVRLCVYKSNMAIYAILIDDKAGKVLASISSSAIKSKSKSLELAKETGLEIAKVALNKKINEVIFDRNGYKYHGKVSALADGARSAGLKL